MPKHFLYIPIFTLSLFTYASSNEDTFSKVIQPFFKQYCVSCHGEDKPKAKFRLDNIKYVLKDSGNYDRWKSVLEQLKFDEMPPEDEKQPNSALKKQVINWINDKFAKSGKLASFNFKVKKPHYGNFINHEKLFSGEIKDKPYTPARLWRIDAKQWNYSKKDLVDGLGKRRYKKREPSFGSKIKSPYSQANPYDFGNYAALVYADKATFDTLNRNAEMVVDQLLRRVSSFKKIISTSKPSIALVHAAIKYQFNRALERPPTKAELKKIFDLHAGSHSAFR